MLTLTPKLFVSVGANPNEVENAGLGLAGSKAPAMSGAVPLSRSREENVMPIWDDITSDESREGYGRKENVTPG